MNRAYGGWLSRSGELCEAGCRGRGLGFGAVVNEIPVGGVFEFGAIVAIVAGEAGIFSG